MSDLEQNIKKMQPVYDGLLQAEESIREALKEAKEDYWEASRAFSKAEVEIFRMTSSSINVYDASLRAKVSNVVHTANSAGDALNTACMRLVQRLDTKCTMLYQEAMDPDLAQQIVKQLHELNEGAKVDLDFSGAFQGISFGHVGTIRYEPSMDALRIEAKWEVIAREAKKKGGIRILLEQYGIAQADWDTHIKYTKAVDAFYKAASSAALTKVKTTFAALGAFRDAKDFVKRCEEKLPQLKEQEAQARQAAEQKEKEEQAQKNREAAEKAAKEAAQSAAFVRTAEKALERIEKDIAHAEKTTEKENTADQKRIAQAKEEAAKQGLFAFGAKSALRKECKLLEQTIAQRLADLEALKAEKAQKREEAEAVLAILRAKSGDEVTFGTRYGSERETPMQWLVVENRDGKCKLLAKYLVAKKRPFEVDKQNYLSRADSYWLSKWFLPAVLTPQQQDMLCYECRDGSSRQVFLPNEEEVRMADPGMKAVDEFAYGEPDSVFVSKYWLGGFSYDSDYISSVYYVDVDGAVRCNSGGAYAPAGIRPVILLNAKKLSESI